MNPAERDSIKEMFGDFLKDLHIDPEFLGPLIENDVLSEGMVDKIQVTCYINVDDSDDGKNTDNVADQDADDNVLDEDVDN